MRTRPYVVLPFFQSAVLASRNHVFGQRLAASAALGANCVIRDTLVGDALYHGPGENARLEVGGGGYFPQSGNDFKFDPTKVRGGVSFIAMFRADAPGGSISGVRPMAMSGTSTTRDPGSGVAGVATSLIRFSLELSSANKITMRDPGSPASLTANIWDTTRPNDWIVACGSSQYNTSGNTQTNRIFAYNLMTRAWSFETIGGNTNVQTQDGYFGIGPNSNGGALGMDLAYVVYLGIPMQQSQMMELLRDPWGPIRERVYRRVYPVVIPPGSIVADGTVPLATPSVSATATVSVNIVGAGSVALPMFSIAATTTITTTIQGDAVLALPAPSVVADGSATANVAAVGVVPLWAPLVVASDIALIYGTIAGLSRITPAISGYARVVPVTNDETSYLAGAIVPPIPPTTINAQVPLSTLAIAGAVTVVPPTTGAGSVALPSFVVVAAADVLRTPTSVTLNPPYQNGAFVVHPTQGRYIRPIVKDAAGVAIPLIQVPSLAFSSSTPINITIDPVTGLAQKGTSPTGGGSTITATVQGASGPISATRQFDSSYAAREIDLITPAIVNPLVIAAGSLRVKRLHGRVTSTLADAVDPLPKVLSSNVSKINPILVGNNNDLPYSTGQSWALEALEAGAAQLYYGIGGADQTENLTIPAKDAATGTQILLSGNSVMHANHHWSTACIEYLGAYDFLQRAVPGRTVSLLTADIPTNIALLGANRDRLIYVVYEYENSTGATSASGTQTYNWMKALVQAIRDALTAAFPTKPCKILWLGPKAIRIAGGDASPSYLTYASLLDADHGAADHHFNFTTLPEFANHAATDPALGIYADDLHLTIPGSQILGRATGAAVLHPSLWS